MTTDCEILTEDLLTGDGEVLTKDLLTGDGEVLMEDLLTGHGDPARASTVQWLNNAGPYCDGE